MPRLGYTKTHSGCLKCRQRRVKCDEKRPCSACARHGVRCSLIDQPDPVAKQRPRRTPKPLYRSADPVPVLPQPPPEEATASNVDVALSPADGDPFPYLARLVKRQGSQYSETWTGDLELMHHFTAITWRSFPRAPEVSDVWQLELPRMAFEHEFLAHQILTISANHMAFLNPDKHSQYSIQASQHQNQAVQGLRGALSEITNSSCHAIFANASLLSINAFATLSEYPNQHHWPGIDDLLHVFLLIRGMHGILKSYESILHTGPLGRLLQLGRFQSTTTLLLDIIQDLQSMQIPREARPSAEACCRESITSLIDWISHARDNASLAELRVVMTWPTNLSDVFVSLVRERYKPVLQILACYCRILESLGDSHWYLKGWGRHVTNDIAKYLWT